MRPHPYGEMWPDYRALHAEQFCVLYQHERSLDFLVGLPESPEEHWHKSRGTLRSPHQHKRDSYTRNQLEMRPDSPALALEPSCIPHQTRQETCLPLGNSTDSPNTQSQV